MYICVCVCVCIENRWKDGGEKSSELAYRYSGRGLNPIKVENWDYVGERGVGEVEENYWDRRI